METETQDYVQNPAAAFTIEQKKNDNAVLFFGSYFEIPSLLSETDLFLSYFDRFRDNLCSLVLNGTVRFDKGLHRVNQYI